LNARHGSRGEKKKEKKAGRYVFEALSLYVPQKKRGEKKKTRAKSPPCKSPGELSLNGKKRGKGGEQRHQP